MLQTSILSWYFDFVYSNRLSMNGNVALEYKVLVFKSILLLGEKDRPFFGKLPGKS